MSVDYENQHFILIRNIYENLSQLKDHQDNMG